MSNDAQVEQQIQAKGLTAPRVTPARIEEVIVSEHYFTAADGEAGSELNRRRAEATEPLAVSPLKGIEEQARQRDPLRLLTFCVLVLKNGYTVTGESACASPENFDAELGRQIARRNAREKIWGLEGYLLRQQLHEA